MPRLLFCRRQRSSSSSSGRRRLAQPACHSHYVESKHHDEPLYILAKAAQGQSIRPAPFINHTDQELMLIETLVGRQPPFVFPSEDYGGVRKPYE